MTASRGGGWRSSRRGRSAAVVAGAAVAVVLGGCGSTAVATPTTPMSPVPTTTPTPTSTPGAASRPITVGKSPDGMVFGDGSVWTANFDGGTVSRIDPATYRVVATVNVGHEPLALDAQPGAVWVAEFGDDTVSRIDTTTNREVATIPVVSMPTGLAMHGSMLWVFGQGKSGGASVIDTTTNTVVRTVPLTLQSGFATAQPDLLWVTDFQGGSDTALGVDPTSGAVVVRVAAGKEPIAVAFGGSAGWVANYGSDSVTRFNPATGAVTATIAIPGGTPNELLAAGSVLYVTSIAGNAVVTIDMHSNAVIGRLPVGIGPRDVLLVGAQLFVDDFADNDVRVLPVGS